MKKYAKKKKKVINTRKKLPWLFLLLLLALPFTVLLAQSSQTLRSSAQAILQTPPVFFCLATGESNKDLCASSTLDAKTSFQLNGYPLERSKIVYYNDTLTGEASYTNTGDTIVTIKKIALVAESENGKSRLEFNPSKQNIVVQPGKTVTVPSAARMFTSPNTSGTWEVFSSVTMASGQRFDNPKKIIVNVSSACTGLRAIPLAESDLTSLKAHCSENALSKLCTSRQYCELTGGAKCEQKAPSQPYLDKHLQCDENIIIPEEEQGFLEEFCEANPDSATCKEFCGRTINSALCKDPNDLDENAELATISQRSTKAVAGINSRNAEVLAEFDCSTRGVINGVPGQCCRHNVVNKNTNECCRWNGPNLPSGQCPRAPGGAPAPQPASGGSTGGSCSAAGGSCKSRSTCSGTVRTGLCPGGVDNICCIGSSAGGGNTGGSTTPRKTCASVGGSCKSRSICTGNIQTGLCPGGVNNICCIGGNGRVDPRLRYETSNGTPRRSCATGRVFRNGRCQRVDGSTPNTPLPTCKGAGAACSSGQCCGTLVCNLTRPGSGTCGRNRGIPQNPPAPRACVGLGNRCSVSNPCCAGSGTCQSDIDGFRCLRR